MTDDRVTGSMTATVDRYEINDWLTAILSARGWYADTEADMERLNELTHRVSDLIEAEIALWVAR